MKKYKESVHAVFPSKFRLLEFKDKKNIEAKINVIKEYNYKIILIKDSQKTDGDYLLVRIRVDAKDKENYYAQIPQKQGIAGMILRRPQLLKEKKMQYNNLESVLVNLSEDFAFLKEFELEKL